MSQRVAPARIARNGFQDITASLKDRIQAGEIQQGSYLPTERELQSGYGASRATVRKALAALVATGIAQSVPNKGVIAALRPTQELATNVGFIHGGSTVLQMFSTRLSELLFQQGLNLVPMAGSSSYPIEYALQRAADSQFAGTFVWSYRGFPDADLVNAVNRQTPIIALDHRITGAETDLVTFEHEQAAFDATSHLIEQGCRRIGVTGMLDMLDITHDRFRGYMRAMFAHDLQPEPRDFLFTFTSGLESPDTAYLEERLSSGDRPDGLLVLQDFCVPTVVEAALSAGLRLPHDLKLAGIGDDIVVSVDGVGITAIAFDWEAVARLAVELLLHRIEDPRGPSQTRVAPHTLVIRGLCGSDESSWAGSKVTRASQRSWMQPKPQYFFNLGRNASISPRLSRRGDIHS